MAPQGLLTQILPTPARRSAVASLENHVTFHSHIREKMDQGLIMSALGSMHLRVTGTAKLGVARKTLFTWKRDREDKVIISGIRGAIVEKDVPFQVKQIKRAISPY